MTERGAVGRAFLLDRVGQEWPTYLFVHGHPLTDPLRGTWNFDTANGVIVVFSRRGSNWIYDPDADTWTRQPSGNYRFRGQ